MKYEEMGTVDLVRTILDTEDVSTVSTVHLKEGPHEWTMENNPTLLWLGFAVGALWCQPVHWDHPAPNWVWELHQRWNYYADHTGFEEARRLYAEADARLMM